MDLIDLAGVKKVAPDVYDRCVIDKKTKKTSKNADEDLSKSKSAVRRLGDWVKNAVNCCIE